MTPATGSPTTQEEGVNTPAKARIPLVEYDSEDEGPEDPMVSNPIRPFIIPVTLKKPDGDRGGVYGALIDSGCTRCLINHRVVIDLGLRVVRLHKPIRFEQVDGTILGGGSLLPILPKK